MQIINWLNSNSGAITGIAAMITAIATVVLAIVTFFYVRVTKKILKESEQMRSDAQKPRIAIYIDFEREQPVEGSRVPKVPIMYLYVENIGMGPAYDVSFDTNPEFLIPDMRLLRDIGFIANDIRYLPPRQTRKLVIGHRYSEGKKLEQLMEEEPLKITVTYKDIRNKESQEDFCLNFGEYESEYSQMVAELRI